MSTFKRGRVIGGRFELTIDGGQLLPGLDERGPGGQHASSTHPRPGDEPDPLPVSGPAHAPGFATVNWCGAVYHFTPKQRAVVALLWAAWKDDCPCVGTAELMQAADSDGTRLRDIFEHGRHPAWNILIVQGQLHGGRAGTWRLAPLPGDQGGD